MTPGPASGFFAIRAGPETVSRPHEISRFQLSPEQSPVRIERGIIQRSNGRYAVKGLDHLRGSGTFNTLEAARAYRDDPSNYYPSSSYRRRPEGDPVASQPQLQPQDNDNHDEDAPLSEPLQAARAALQGVLDELLPQYEEIQQEADTLLREIERTRGAIAALDGNERDAAAAYRQPGASREAVAPAVRERFNRRGREILPTPVRERIREQVREVLRDGKRLRRGEVWEAVRPNVPDGVGEGHVMGQVKHLRETGEVDAEQSGGPSTTAYFLRGT